MILTHLKSKPLSLRMTQKIGPDRLFLNITAGNLATLGSSVDPAILPFHQTLPQYSQTPLVSLSEIAKELGLGGVFVKDETSRFGLPSFKILGASWATFCAVTDNLGLSREISIGDLAQATRTASVKVFAATEGNHGRAVAHMAAVIGAQAFIFVPKNVDHDTIGLITGEGATTEIIDGDYDQAVHVAANRSTEENGILIQDTAWDGYEQIPQVRQLFMIPSQLFE
jgi:diaminopropionate ammonia-lyase family